jgi:hypothetical protein
MSKVVNDPDRVAAVIAAMKPVVATFTFDGFAIASHVTDAEYQALAQAAVQADQDYIDAPKI